jgi:hypothetical protein
MYLGNLIPKTEISSIVKNTHPFYDFTITPTNKYTNGEYIMLDSNKSMLEINVTKRFDTIVKTDIVNLPLLNYDKSEEKDEIKYAYYKNRPTTLSDIVNTKYVTQLELIIHMSDKFGKMQIPIKPTRNIRNRFSKCDILIIHLTIP